MTCQACVRSVTDAVNGLGAGVVTVIDLSKKEVRVTGPKHLVTLEKIKQAVSAVGHEATSCSSNVGSGICSAGSACTCGPECSCGDNCTCGGCPGSCGVKGKGPCKARGLGKCTCGPVCECGDNCKCATCPSEGSSQCCSSKGMGKCSAGSACTCGDNCQCGDACACSSCPGVTRQAKPCKAKAVGTCTCGDNCTCGDDCKCADCPGGRFTGINANTAGIALVAGAAFALGFMFGKNRALS
eukprot:CAMPEP_0204823098 /NCGR_PEP_ID=MMETSP1346-20131115/1232_1 /ASSEMBLY_ACC=CAM_ASM_000771 /TAXON_ID=215587 /ORGANISM="Aplanochytrium stocchinoi, Strain GSBS06" /LENGTH=240 /DNA_ID=CAMNT_0051949631 /DNA_START=320 /DNA_END=1042 /DNA_ORIENTATION=-